MQQVKVINVLIVGGSGVWSEKNHIPNLLALKREYPHIRVSAICDIDNPYDKSPQDRPNLSLLLACDKPKWVPVDDNVQTTLKHLDTTGGEAGYDLVIIACNPTDHYTYAKWALQHEISVVCDKPLVSVPKAASDVNAARQILSRYVELCDLYAKAKQQKPYLTFSLILRRRGLPAFNVLADNLQSVFKEYDAGINHINLLSHNGIHKYPLEMVGKGAHDFSSGVGSLSHSAYHYIDLFNYYFSIAPGQAVSMRPRLIHVFRVGDYLDVKGYDKIQRANDHKPTVDAELPNHVLAAELDFAFHIDFFDREGRIVANGNFVSNHTSFSPRTRDYQEGVSEPAHYKDGGRISNLYIDIHQSGLQNLQLIKNDLTFEPSNIFIQRRTHPKIALESYEKQYFEDAYDRTEHTMKDLLRDVLVALMKREPQRGSLVIDLLDDARNVKLYSKFYELIAEDLAAPHKSYDVNDVISLVD